MAFSNKSEKNKDNFNKFLANNNYWNIFFEKIKSKNFINSAYYTFVIPNFKPNKLIGFFRNDFSIHSVTTSITNINEKRKALPFL
jgi:hypothetical protein